MLRIIVGVNRPKGGIIMNHRWRILAAIAILTVFGCTAPGAVTATITPSATPTGQPVADVSTPAAGPTVTPSPSPAPPTDAPPSLTPSPHPSGGGQSQPVPTAPPSGGAVIDTFTASADTVHPGDKITLTWHTNVARVSIRVILNSGQYGQWFDQPGAGSMDYTVDAKERNAFQIQLVAEPAGNEAYKNLPFSIICPDSWFVDGAPSTCPNPALKGDWVAQKFEHGIMVWIGASKSILIIRDDNVWGTYPDTWQPGMPESDPGLTPPDGLFQPVRGFGKVWRDYDRSAIGWALAPEYATPITYQCDSVFKSAVCILSGPTGLLILNMWGGGWKKYTVP
jgi:hypothetical protein